MKSVVLPEYNKNIIRAMLSLKVNEVEKPVASDNDVVIKVFASPVNPSDIAFIQGGYNIVKTLPAVPGFEASGEVVDGGVNCTHLIGKKVSCFVQNDLGGTWSEFCIANKNDIIVLDDRMDMEQAACLTVNPFTARGMFDIAIQREATSIIQNAAGSQVAHFIRLMASEYDMEVINIVRKDETAVKLKSEGNRYVLVENEDDFEKKLAELSAYLKPTVAYDAVGCNLSGMMLNALAPDSELVVYGGLAGKQIGQIDVMDIIFENKIVTGFNLIDWKSDIGEELFNEISIELQEKFISGSYRTIINGSYGLEEIVAGLRAYIADMSGGKLLIKP